MRTLLICSFMLIIPLVLHSQEEDKRLRKHDEYQKEFEEFLEESEIGFDYFIDSLNGEYADFIIESENVFSELLKHGFNEYEAIISEMESGNSKPSCIQEFEPASKELVTSGLFEKEMFFPERGQVLISPVPIAEKSSDTTLKVTFQFLGSLISVEYDQRINQMPGILKINPETISNTYDFLRNTDYQHILNQLDETCRMKNMNDWDFYCLIHKFAGSVKDRLNEQKIIAWFLLMESNYKVKIGYFNESVEVLFASSEAVYNIPWFNVNGERYYVQQYDYNIINTYDLEYFKGYKYLNIFHDKPLILEEVRKSKTIKFPFKNDTCSIKLSFDQAYVDYYSKYPMLPIEYYFALPVSLAFKESIEYNIGPELKGKNTDESLQYLLSMVQYGFEYVNDTEQFDHEKYMVPDELLFYEKSDCDDRSIFFSHLVRELLHRNVLALDFNGHLCPAVEVSDSSGNWNIIYNDKKFIVCDPTYVGAIPGLVLPPFKIKDAVIIDFNKNLGLYSYRKEIWKRANEKGLLQAENDGNLIISNDGNTFLTGVVTNDTLLQGDQVITGPEKTTTFIARLNSKQEIHWIKQLDGCGSNSGYCISEFNDEFLYVFGYFKDTISLDDYMITADGDGSFYLAKLDRSGNTHWLQSIQIPDDTLFQVLNVVFDTDGSLKYYWPDVDLRHEENYVMSVDEKGYCYISALLPGAVSGLELSRYFAGGESFDIIDYLINGNNNLLKQNYPKSVSLLFTLIQFLINNGSVIEGPSLLKAISTIYSNKISDLPGPYSELGKISEIGNHNGITLIKTIDEQPVTVNQLRALHESRLKLSYVNGNAKIDVLNGIKIGGNVIWNDVNYILLDKTTGEIRFQFDNQYRKKMPVHSQLM